MASVFLSYALDDREEIPWVKALGTRLVADGVAVTMDQGATVPSDQFVEFLERIVAAHEYVLVVCTPKYRQRSEQWVEGTPYPGDVMTARIRTSGNQRKFIPVLRLGDWGQSGPVWLREHFYDMREGPRYEARYHELLSAVQGVRGRPSTPVAPARPVPVEAPSEEDPVKIIGVIAEEVGTPKQDGTYISTFYRVPLRLSKPVDQKWENIFERTWNTSPRFTALRRASLAKVNYDRIVMSCTTLDEVLNEHRMMLIQCVLETNRIVAEQEAAARRTLADYERQIEEHRRHVTEMVDRVRFE